MKNKGYPFLNTDRLSYKFKCVCCGAYIKKGLPTCYRCHHHFSPDDVTKMIEYYRSNYAKNWHHKISFILFILFVLVILVIANK